MKVSKQTNRSTACVNSKLSGRMILILALVMGGMILTTAPPATAGGQSSARSLAMAGAYSALATGVDAARFNPANLGLTTHRDNGLELIGMGVNLSNNSITLNDYNKYTGALLTDSDKDDILGKIPDDGLRLMVDVEATALSLSLGSIVISNQAMGSANVNLSKDIIDLAFNGNTMGHEIELTGSYSDAVAYVQTGVSYGRPVYQTIHSEISVGATVKYLKGLALEQVTELEGNISTLASGFSGAGHMVAQTATGGSGWGLDLGAAWKINDNYVAGVTIKNFISKINWIDGTEEYGYLFSFDTMTVDNMEADYVVSEDYSNEIDGFSTSLPSVMTVGFANITGNLVWGIDWVQGFKTAAGSSTKPRLAAGAEYKGIGMLPLRIGFGTGGERGTGFAVGAGLDLALVQIDFGVQTGTSMSAGSAKGLNMAFGLGIDF